MLLIAEHIPNRFIILLLKSASVIFFFFFKLTLETDLIQSLVETELKVKTEQKKTFLVAKESNKKASRATAPEAHQCMLGNGLHLIWSVHGTTFIIHMHRMWWACFVHYIQQLR